MEQVEITKWEKANSDSILGWVIEYGDIEDIITFNMKDKKNNKNSFDHMEQTIREKIEDLVWETYASNSGDHVKNITDQIMLLIPTWKVFSEDCKPEVGDLVLLADDGFYLHKKVIFWANHNEADLDIYIRTGKTFYVIPTATNFS